MILIGSGALNLNTAKDIDLICSDEELATLKDGCKFLYPIAGGKYVAKHHFEERPIEIEISRDGNSAEVLDNLLTLYPNEVVKTIKLFGLNGVVPSLDVLYMLKMSHRYLRNSPFFQKTRQDILRLRKHCAKMIEEPGWSEWYKQREKETYWYSHPNLKRTKDKFFAGDNIEYIYDHDWLHTQVAIYDKPMYTRYQVEGEEVLSSKRKFDALTHIEKGMAVAEEAMVLALERAIIPNGMDVLRAKKIALEKVCTSITSGWFREFAWENYDLCWEILKSMEIPRTVFTPK